MADKRRLALKVILALTCLIWIFPLMLWVAVEEVLEYYGR